MRFDSGMYSLGHACQHMFFKSSCLSTPPLLWRTGCNAVGVVFFLLWQTGGFDCDPSVPRLAGWTCVPVSVSRGSFGQCSMLVNRWFGAFFCDLVAICAQNIFHDVRASGCANFLLMAGAAGLRMHHRLHNLLIVRVAVYGLAGELARSMYCILRLDRNVYFYVWAYSVFPGALRIAAPVFARTARKIC